MDSAPGYDEVAKFAETNTTHPERVIIAYHIRCGRYDIALELLAKDTAAPAADDDQETALTRTRLPELQMMIEHLRQVETSSSEEQAAS